MPHALIDHSSMKNRYQKLTVCGLFVSSLLLAGTGYAQPDNPEIPGLTERGRRELEKNPVPDLTSGGKPNEMHDWNLGPTGLRGVHALP